VDLYKFFDEIDKLINLTKQGSLFGRDEKTLKTKTQALCVEFLKGNGCSVRLPLEYPVNIRKLEDLTSLFYGLLGNRYPEHLLPNINIKKDLVIAKQLVEHRMEVDNVDRPEALRQCGDIILTVFRNPDVFKFPEPPTFGIFSKNMFWFANEVINFMNARINNKEQAELEKLIAEMDVEIEKYYSNSGYSLSELDKIRERLKDKYGKKG
jgi:hypothetical protein